MNPKPETPNLKNVYTDAPELHPNLILGSLQLLCWLFFHPSAWRSHVARIDPDLHPDFTLAELSRAQWRNPALRRLLAMGYVIWPSLVALTVGLVLWVRGASVENVTGPVVYIVAVNLTIGLVIGALVHVAAGLVGGIVAGLAVGIVGSLTVGEAETVAVSVASSVAIGLTASIAGSIATRRSMYSLTRQAGGIIVGILIGTGAITILNLTASGILGSLVYDLMSSTAASVVGGIILGISFSFSFSLPYLLGRYIGGPWAGATAGALGGGGRRIAQSIIIWNTKTLLPSLHYNLTSILLGLTVLWWLPVFLYPFLTAWNFFLHRIEQQRTPNYSGPSRLHSAFWDEHQWLHLLGLDEHLVLVMERNPVEGQVAIEYLTTTRQRWAAQAAQIELDARWLENCADVTAIGAAHRVLAAGELAGPASALLRSFSRVGQDVDAALRQESAYNRRLALSAVEDRLDSLLHELTQSSERYAVRFHPITAHWRQIVADHVRELAETVERRQEIDSPYVIGVPLTERQEIFVGRTDVGAHIEQLLLDRRRPPLLLYGQRRTGKTSLLNNLGRLLPTTIIPLFVDLQGPASRASDHAGLLYNIARGMIDSAGRQRRLILPPLTREALAADPFTRFDEWLDEVESSLGQHTALLALDEFEALDSAIAKGRFGEEEVLGTLRHLIQHRPRFKVLLSGTHTLDEVQRWASYLINVQVVHIGYLKESEARQLVERPVEDFALRYEPDASQRVLDLTRGHPFLVQLLCAEVVALKNEQPPATRRLARLVDVEAAVPEALSHGSFFFADIERNQVDGAGLALLRFMAAQGEGALFGRESLARQFPKELDHTLNFLVRRELIERANGGYCFQVELIRRWFARGGAT